MSSGLNMISVKANRPVMPQYCAAEAYRISAKAVQRLLRQKARPLRRHRPG